MEAIDLLPFELKMKSLSKKEVILSYEDVLKAIDIYAQNNWVILNWEGWIKYSKNKHGHSEKFRGISNIYKEKDETWESFVKRSAIRCIETINESKQKWDSKPEYLGSILYFCLNPEEKPKSEEDLDNYIKDFYFCYSATLRIWGNRINDFKEITKTLGLVPSHTHRKGEPINIKRPGKLWEHDMWSYKAPVEEEEPLDAHIQVLWNGLKSHKKYLLGLKENLIVDVFLGYRSNTGTAGFKISAESMKMFVELNIPFEVSIIVV